MYEFLVVLTFIGMAITASSKWAIENQRTNTAAGLSQELNMVSKASQNFLDANSVILREKLEDKDHIIVTQNSITDKNGAPLSVTGDIKNGLESYLPIVFDETRYKQSVKLYVYKNDGGIFGLVTTMGGVPKTGNEHEKRRYLQIARKAVQMSGFGMFIDKNNKGTDIQAIVGKDDAWRFILNDKDYGNIPQGIFDVGQLAKPLSAYAALAKDDMLYRVEIDGHPELNAMQTDLHMNGWEITDVGTITISQNPNIQGSGEIADVPNGGNGLIIEPYKTTGDVANSAQAVCEGLAGGSKPNGFIFTVDTEINDGQTEHDMNGIWMCMNDKARLIADSQNSTTIKGVAIKRHGESIKKPQCPIGTKASIYVSPVAFAEGQNKPGAVTAVQTLAEDKSDQWRIKIRVKTTSHKDGEWAWLDGSSGGGMPNNASSYNFALVQTMCERGN